MTKSQIKAELRRSAMEDYFPPIQCDFEAWLAAYSYRDQGFLFDKSFTTRMFFLFVAEAL